MRKMIPVFLLLCSTTTLADEVRLQDGRILVGIVRDRPANAKWIRLEVGAGSLSLLRADVLSIQRGRTALHDYYDLWEGVKESRNPENFFRLFDFARKNRLPKFGKELMQIVLRLDPENETARRRLGFRKFQGKWMTSGEINTALGMVRVNGKWMTTADRALIRSRRLSAELKKEEKELRKAQRKVLREYPDEPKTIRVAGGVLHRPNWFWPYYYRPDRVLPGRTRFPVGYYDASPTLDILDFPGIVIPGGTP